MTMSDHIQIEGDPTVWTLRQPIDADRISKADAPLALAVMNPLSGTLLLSASAAASVTLFPAEGIPLNPRGWIPGDVTLPFPALYLPSVLIPDSGALKYQLSEATAVQLAHRIKTAMATRTKITVPFGDAGNNGEVVLNGALLPFAVICPFGAPTGG
jgi:hypothetical protein